MKTRSAYDREVYFEKWQTPMTEGDSIWLKHQFITYSYIYFFFQLYSDQFKNNYVMKLGRYSPFRITEECNAVGFISKYFCSATKKPKKIYLNSNGHYIRTWKLWNTQYIKEIDSNCALSGYTKKRNKNIYQYLIKTQEEWIEFISPDEPEWKVYKNKSLEELIMNYTKKSIE